MSSKSLATATALATVFVFAQAAGAHPWPYHVGGFAAGVTHPFTGIDHILAMIAVGICAAQRGGRAIWLLPATFLVSMVAGGIAGLVGHDVPAIEQGIAASVLILGLMVAAGSPLPMVLMLSLVSIFAVFHGYAHGVELGPGLAPFTFAIGFVIATATLHLIGIALGLFAAARIKTAVVPRLVGGMIAAGGLLLFCL